MEMLVRRPLQPKNLNSIPTFLTPIKKPKKPNQKTITVSVSPLVQQKETSDEKKQIELDVKKESDCGLLKEVSLAEELEIVRKRKERLRLEREKTEILLKERASVLDRAMEAMERRAEEQSNIELEMYKVVLLKELRSSSMRVCPVQSLREKEEEKKKREAQSVGVLCVESPREKEQEKKKIEPQTEANSFEINSEESSSDELELHREVPSSSSEITEE